MFQLITSISLFPGFTESKPSTRNIREVTDTLSTICSDFTSNLNPNCPKNLHFQVKPEIEHYQGNIFYFASIEVEKTEANSPNEKIEIVEITFTDKNGKNQFHLNTNFPNFCYEKGYPDAELRIEAIDLIIKGLQRHGLVE